MADPADLLGTTVLARELVAAHHDDGLRVLAVTSRQSLVAGMAARRLGAPDLALAVGFGVLDAVDPAPSAGAEDPTPGPAGAYVGPSSDTFVAVARGMVGVCTTPAQLDAHGAVNLSGIGGEPGRPAVALPGSRGLPDNNDMAGPVWYVLGAHTPRQLVPRVDFVSGVPPRAGRRRRLLTPSGSFALSPSGWTAVSLHPGVDPGGVAAATGFEIRDLDTAPETPGPTDDERAAVAAVAPAGEGSS
jgi:glutaconate CoA-transferase subunit B